jgi:hypothetical protein
MVQRRLQINDTAQRIVTLRPSTLINRHKTAVPPSVAPAHSLWLRCFPDPFPDEAI